MTPRIATFAVLTGLLGCTPELAGVVSPGPGWPDLAQPPVGVRDGRADAALIVAIDDPALGGRPGAFEVGSGWWRYLVRTRGLRRARVTLLRNDEATAAAIELAVEQLEEHAGAGSVLWLVFIGSAVSPGDGADGALVVSGGERVPFGPIRAALAAGFHESAFMLVDACAEAPTSGRVAGLPSQPPVEESSRFLAAARQRTAARTYYIGSTSSAGSALGGAIDRAHAAVETDLRREATTLRNSFVLTAGVGPACGATLDGRPWPALAYAGLGGLQGWADIDEDGQVSAIELATYAQSVLAGLDEAPLAGDGPDQARARLSAGGVDIILADVSERWSGPRRLAPESLSQTETSIEQATTLLELRVEDMVPVPAGRFTMGCTRKQRRWCEADERPARQIELDGFTIDRTEVTWADYRACVEAGVCLAPLLSDCWVWTGEGFVRGAELPAELFGDDYPAMCINWPEAQTFCEAVGKRLPTEPEWERAARGVDGRTYPWGEAPPTCARAVMHNCSDFTQGVGRHLEGHSPVGAVDMSGNVSEWVDDWWGERSYASVDRHNPEGPPVGEVRGVRGGSFYDSDFNLRTSYRYGIEPLARLSTVGFRCAR